MTKTIFFIFRLGRHTNWISYNALVPNFFTRTRERWPWTRQSMTFDWPHIVRQRPFTIDTFNFIQRIFAVVCWKKSLEIFTFEFDKISNAFGVEFGLCAEKWANFRINFYGFLSFPCKIRPRVRSDLDTAHPSNISLVLSRHNPWTFH